MSQNLLLRKGLGYTNTNNNNNNNNNNNEKESSGRSYFSNGYSTNVESNLLTVPYRHVAVATAVLPFFALVNIFVFKYLLLYYALLNCLVYKVDLEGDRG
jgi:hypothetical protein